jgi:Xaa-Pro aminopeptidase
LVHHEDPVIDAHSTDLLQAGMVLSIEMEFRHAEVGHVKVEDMVAITQTGNELLIPSGSDWFLSHP